MTEEQIKEVILQYLTDEISLSECLDIITGKTEVPWSEVMPLIYKYKED